MPFNFQALCFADTLSHSLTLSPFFSLCLLPPPVCLSFLLNPSHTFRSRCFTLFTIFVYFSVTIMWFFVMLSFLHLLGCSQADAISFVHLFHFFIVLLVSNCTHTFWLRERERTLSDGVDVKNTYADERRKKISTKWRNKNGKVSTKNGHGIIRFSGCMFLSFKFATNENVVGNHFQEIQMKDYVFYREKKNPNVLIKLPSFPGKRNGCIYV